MVTGRSTTNICSFITMTCILPLNQRTIKNILGAKMKNITKALMTGMVMVTVLVGCQSLSSMTAPATNEPEITGTDVI
jgi:hypothetical protein